MVGLRNDGLVREEACLYASVDSSSTFHCPTFLSSNDAVLFSITRRSLCKPRVDLVSKCYFGPRAREGRSPASQGGKLTYCTTAMHAAITVVLLYHSTFDRLPSDAGFAWSCPAFRAVWKLFPGPCIPYRIAEGEISGRHETTQRVCSIDASWFNDNLSMQNLCHYRG